MCLICLQSSTVRVNLLPYFWQRKCFFSMWILLWLKKPDWKKEYVPVEQPKGSLSVWIFLWILRTQDIEEAWSYWKRKEKMFCKTLSYQAQEAQYVYGSDVVFALLMFLVFLLLKYLFYNLLAQYYISFLQWNVIEVSLYPLCVWSARYLRSLKAQRFVTENIDT